MPAMARSRVPVAAAPPPAPSPPPAARAAAAGGAAPQRGPAAERHWAPEASGDGYGMAMGEGANR